MREKKILNTITGSILEKKGKEIVIIDLSTLNYAFCDYFVVCHGDSTTQVSAVADHIVDKVKEGYGIQARHIEGIQNAQWVLIDLGSIVVHIFLKEQRDFYRLEDLWGDAKITRIEEE
ncbi:MAG: ribosome silencing factor [Bacteroidales bacterium]|nr:ribosome silencing factor [Bacteroidales bacterium]